MKRVITLVLSFAVFMGVCVFAQAAKVSQPPKTDLSYDFASESKTDWHCIMADDWTCPDGEPIIGIRWWGSYWSPPTAGAYSIYSDLLGGADPGGVTSFSIMIAPNEPAGGTMPFDHPGSTLVQWDVPIAAANETNAFTVTKSTSPSVTENIYEYYADLSTDPFAQTQGAKYWLIVVANLDDSTKQWGWHDADGQWGSYSVQSVDDMTSWYVPCGGHEMAFELEIVPEPASIAALSTGLIGLLGFACASRRRRARG